MGRIKIRRILAIGCKTVICLLLLSVMITVPWRWISLPTSSFMIQTRLEREAENAYTWTAMNDISSQLAIAVIASEDQKFPDHQGFDFESIDKAIKERSKRVRGASTISQQVAKNLFLWPGKSLFRKGIEAYFTGLIELFWPKRRILEVYLNIAEFGPGVFGAAAASQYHFRKVPKDLTAHEAALLAAILPNPKKMSAGRPSAYVLKRAAQIEQEVRSLGGVKYLSRL